MVERANGGCESHFASTATMMMMEDEDPLLSYKQELNNLVQNSKPQILMLTMLADDYKDEKAPEIVEIIMQRLYAVTHDKKLPTLYLIDSLCKNVIESPYIEHFKCKISTLFCHVFERADERTRLLLFRLRNTWGDVFDAQTLYRLDLDVRKLDPGWPVIAAPNGTQSTIVMSDKVAPATVPMVSSKRKSPPRKGGDVVSTNQSSTFPDHLRQQQRSHIDMDLHHEIMCMSNGGVGVGGGGGGQLSPTSSSLNTKASGKIDSKRKLSQNKNTSPIKIRKKSANEKASSFHSSSQQQQQPQSPPSHRQPRENLHTKSSNNKSHFGAGSNSNRSKNTNNNNNKSNKSAKRKQATTTTQSLSHAKPAISPNNRASNKKSSNLHGEIAIPPPPPSGDVIPLGSSHCVPVTKRSKPDPRAAAHRNESSGMIAMIKSRRSPPLRRRSRSPPPLPSSSSADTTTVSTTLPPRSSSSSSSVRISPNKSLPSVSRQAADSSNSTIQTTIPAPNIFAQPQMIFSFPNATGPKNDSTAWSDTPSTAATTGGNAAFGMDRDYRNEFDSFINDAQNKLNAGAISSADHEIMVREAERQFYEMQSGHIGSAFGPNTSNTHSQHPPQQLPHPPQPPQQQQQQPQFIPHPHSQHPSHLPPQPQPQPQPQQPPPPSGPQQVSGPLIEPHGSVVLFINNELRRLYYIDSITAIVLKAHPDTPFDQLVYGDPSLLEPKQVFFSGMPTTVFIDPATPAEQTLRLEFNERMAANFFLPGVPIPQRVMLGLPTRELIVNGCPYQVGFGGPGVRIFFDCDNKYHEFRLSDSRPLLKFSDDVRYDLWHQLVQAAKHKAATAFSVGGAPPLPSSHYSGPSSHSVAPLPPHPYAGPPIQSYPPFDKGATAPPMQSAMVAQSLPPQPPPDQSTAASVVPAFSTSSLDINGLFSKLTDFGLITSSAQSTTSNDVITSAAAAASTSSDSKTSKSFAGDRIAPKMTKSAAAAAKRARKEAQPKQYIPLDVASLKGAHQYAIDQLYSGVQCTNCSLRFPDIALRDEQGADGKRRKSRYARHLDWHFRQNRREKTKPSGGGVTGGGGSSSNSASGSTNSGTNTTSGANSASGGSGSVPHRRSWYYSIDLWILYKEVNDDIEEDGVGAIFFDSTNAANNRQSKLLGESGGGSAAASAAAAFMNSFDFTPYQTSIDDFDAFIEAINCDNSNSASASSSSSSAEGQRKAAVCSVVPDPDTTKNCCTVCNEKLDLEWHEDEEEWRLKNTVRFTAPALISDDDNEDRPLLSSGLYHSLCLKDCLIQHAKKCEEAEKAEMAAVMDMDDSFAETRSDVVPGLDIPVTQQPPEAEEKFTMGSGANRKMLIPGLDCEMKTEDDDDEADESSITPIDSNELDRIKEENDSENVEQSIAMEQQQNDGEDEEKPITNEVEENFEVKVIEYEIPIAMNIAAKNESIGEDVLSVDSSISADICSEQQQQQQQETLAMTSTTTSTTTATNIDTITSNIVSSLSFDESTNDSLSAMSPKPTISSSSTDNIISGDQQPIQQQQQQQSQAKKGSPNAKIAAAQPKRGGIVIKMKKANTIAAIPAVSTSTSASSCEPMEIGADSGDGNVVEHTAVKSDEDASSDPLPSPAPQSPIECKSERISPSSSSSSTSSDICDNKDDNAAAAVAASVVNSSDYVCNEEPVETCVPQRADRDADNDDHAEDNDDDNDNDNNDENDKSGNEAMVDLPIATTVGSPPTSSPPGDQCRSSHSAAISPDESDESEKSGQVETTIDDDDHRQNEQKQKDSQPHSPSLTASSNEQPQQQPQQQSPHCPASATMSENYYSRGEEVSSLCSIM